MAVGSRAVRGSRDRTARAPRRDVTETNIVRATRQAILYATKTSPEPNKVDISLCFQSS